MRRGITRVEALTALTIVLVAVALGAVGVQKVREAAARATCSNNLKQHGLAVHTYHDAYTYFPTGTMPNPDVPPEQRLSFHVTLVPYIECSKLYSNFALSEPWDSPTNASAVANLLPRIYHCPQWQSSHGPLPTGHLAITNYVGVAGVGTDAAMRPADAPGIGFFGYDRKLKLTDVKDALENTAMIFETGRDVGPWIRGGPSTVRAVDLDDLPPTGFDRPFGGTHTIWQTPLHRRTGFNVLLADGSVRFTSSDISAEVLAALATIAGGEAIPAEW